MDQTCEDELDDFDDTNNEDDEDELPGDLGLDGLKVLSASSWSEVHRGVMDLLMIQATKRDERSLYKRQEIIVLLWFMVLYTDTDTDTTTYNLC